MRRLPTKPCVTFVLACVVMAAASASYQARAADKDASLPITVINYSALPVHATAIALDEEQICAKLGLPTGGPLQLRTGDKGSSVLLARGTENGRPVIWLYMSLPPSSRLDVMLERAERWPDRPDQGRRLWLQANTEYPDRETVLNIGCSRRPELQVRPPAAEKVGPMDEAAKTIEPSSFTPTGRRRGDR